MLLVGQLYCETSVLIVINLVMRLLVTHGVIVMKLFLHLYKQAGSY
jgi:hypothetical protein